VLAFVTVAGTTRALRHLADRRDVLRLITDLESHIGGHVAATAQRHADQRRTAFVKNLQQLYLAIFAAVAAVADPAHVVLLRDDEATVDEVGRRLDGASLVHLASHGLFRRRNAAFSSIRLADGWLRSADVAGHDLRGATVILSACETGRVGDDGHRALGLAQGFLSAGARSVVVSQWLVDDISTEQLMVRLHGHLGSPPDAATALRKAQLETQQHYPHPYHWAPFMAVGAPASGEIAS
jgi:CHAT domain-containing protein